MSVTVFSFWDRCEGCKATSIWERKIVNFSYLKVNKKEGNFTFFFARPMLICYSMTFYLTLILFLNLIIMMITATTTNVAITIAMIVAALSGSFFTTR